MSELLRIATAGSVDDGKSTLIGRLLFDSKAIFEDQLDAVSATSRARGSEAPDLALVTDGLRAEREQGITIDVAYRYFATPKRKFIIADTPGHIQYTRNMVTGASTADVALILIDARNGVLEQSRRHAFLATLLGIPHLVICINKMDLVDFDEAIYKEIRTEFEHFAAKLEVRDLSFIPVSALTGDNVVTRSDNMPWYEGASLLHHLEDLHIASDRNLVDVRLPVQYVIRPHQARDEGHATGFDGRQLAQQRRDLEQLGPRAAHRLVVAGDGRPPVAIVGLHRDDRQRARQLAAVTAVAEPQALALDRLQRQLLAPARDQLERALALAQPREPGRDEEPAGDCGRTDREVQRRPAEQRRERHRRDAEDDRHHELRAQHALARLGAGERVIGTKQRGRAHPPQHGRSRLNAASIPRVRASRPRQDAGSAVSRGSGSRIR